MASAGPSNYLLALLRNALPLVGIGAAMRTSSDTFVAAAKPKNRSSSTATVVTRDLQIVACPKCTAQFMFYGGNAPRIDDCGFES